MPDLNGKRVLITGAGGFIAASLNQSLVDLGAEVHGLVRPSTNLWRLAQHDKQIKIHTVDLMDGEGLKRLMPQIQPDYVIHLAVQGVDPTGRVPAQQLSVSVLGTFNLLDSLKDNPVTRIIIIGSSTEYGQKPRPMAESDLLEPISIHGVGKAAATLVATQFARSTRLPVTVLRLFTIYGPWESAHRLIPTAIGAALREKIIRLTAPGYRHDYVYVQDVVTACLQTLAADLPPGEIINIGSGQQYTNEQVISLISQLTGKALTIQTEEYPPNLWDTSYWVANPEKAQRLLQWQPHYSLSAGLEATIAWFRQHLTAYE